MSDDVLPDESVWAQVVEYLATIQAVWASHGHEYEQPGVEFGPGLSDAEVESAEQAYGFTFPSDLRAFLRFALPVSHGFVDWRSKPRDELEAWLAAPVDGVCYDVEHNGFWLDEWGTRPADLRQAITVARRSMRSAPQLVPVCGHRYLPTDPPEAGNPVFSVHQSDVVEYANNLLHYLAHEFQAPGEPPAWAVEGDSRPIPFWTYLTTLEPDL